MPLPVLTADEVRQITQQSSVQGLGAHLAALSAAGYINRKKWAAPKATAAADLVAAVTLASGATTTLTAAQIIQPDMARTVKLVVSLAGGSLAGNGVISGTDINGRPISETIALTTATTYESTRAFATITSLVLPARTTSGDTVSLGTGTKLGLPTALFRNSVLNFTVDLATDTYTLTPSTAETALNVVAPGTAPNGVRNYRMLWVDERD